MESGFAMGKLCVGKPRSRLSISAGAIQGLLQLPNVVVELMQIWGPHDVNHVVRTV